MENFIEKVLIQNRLNREFKAFLNSGKESWYVDRHVALNPCQEVVGAWWAAIKLLKLWETEIIDLSTDGIYFSKPVFMVDDRWIAGDWKAEIPHVFVAISKRESIVKENNHIFLKDDFSSFPLREAVQKELGVRKAEHVAPLDLEESYYWVVG
jgi:hypothetical protein